MADSLPTVTGRGEPVILPDAVGSAAEPNRRDLKEAESQAEEVALLLLLLLLARSGRRSRGGIVWDARRGVFIQGTGRRRRVVSQAEIRDMLDRLSVQVGTDIEQLTALMIAERITVPQWQQEFRNILKPALLIASVVAVGGVRLMQRADWQFMADQTRIQWESLNKFAAEIKKGLTPAKIRARARSYAGSIRVLYHQFEQRVQARAGKTEALRNLTAAEHCQPCVDHAPPKMSWLPIAEMPPIGSFPFDEGGCAQFCKCYLTFR